MRNLPVVVLLLFACRIAVAAQTLSANVQSFVKVNAPVVALTHVRVIDGTARRHAKIRPSFSVMGRLSL